MNVKDIFDFGCTECTAAHETHSSFSSVSLNSQHFLSETTIRQVIDEFISELKAGEQKVKDEVFCLVQLGSVSVARDKVEEGRDFNVAINTLKLLKTKLGVDKE